MGQAVSYGTRLPWAPSSIRRYPMKSRRYATRRLMRRLQRLRAYFLSRYSEARARADGLGDPAQLTAATWEASTWDEAVGFLNEIVDGKQTSIGARGIGVSHVTENGLHRLPSHLMAHLGIPHGGGVYLTAEISPGVVTIESEDCWNKRAGFPVESMPEDYAHGFKTGDIVTGTLPVEVAAKFVVTRAYEESVVIRKLGQDALSVNGGEVYISPGDLRHAPLSVNDWVRDLRYPREAPVSFSADLHEQRIYYVRVAPPKQEAASADFEPGDIVTTLDLDGATRYVVKSVSLAGSSVDITDLNGVTTKAIEPKFLRRPDVREGDWVRCPERPQDGFFVMPTSDMARVSKFVPVVTHFPSTPAPAVLQEIKVGDTVERSGNSGVVTDARGGHLTVETNRGTRYWRNDEVTVRAVTTPETTTFAFEPGDAVLFGTGFRAELCHVVRLVNASEADVVNCDGTTFTVNLKDLRHPPINDNEEFWVRCTERPGKTFHMSSEAFEAHEDHFEKLVLVDGPEEEAPVKAPVAGFRYTRDNMRFERGDTLWCGAFPAGHTSKVIDVSAEAAAMWEHLFGTKMSRDGFIHEVIWPDRREFLFELLNQGLVMLVVSSNKIEIATARIAHVAPPQKQALDRLVGKERGPVFFLGKEMGKEHGRFYCGHSGERPGETVVFHSPRTDTWGASFKTRDKYGPRLTGITVTGHGSPQEAADALVNELRVTRSELTTMLAAHSKEKQVPITPAPDTAVQNQPSKQLRVGFFKDKKLVKEDDYKPGQIIEYVSISEHIAIRLTSDGCTLQFTEHARGRVGAGSITRDLEGLREDNVAKNDGARWVIGLTEDMHGLLELDSHVTAAFKFVSVPAPAPDAKPEGTAVPETTYNASDHFARLNELSRATPESNPEPAPSPKLLRVGMFKNDPADRIKECTFQPEMSVKVGTDKENDFVTTESIHWHATRPAGTFVLFPAVKGQRVLNFTDSMRGRVIHGGVLRDLYDLKASGIAKPVEDTHWQLLLDNDSRGRITTRSETFLFQFVNAPTTDVPPEPSPEPPAEPSDEEGDPEEDEGSENQALIEAIEAVSIVASQARQAPREKADDPKDVYDQLVSSDYCNKFIKGSSLKKPARVGDLFVAPATGATYFEPHVYMVYMSENYKRPSTPTVRRVTHTMAYDLSHGLDSIRQGDAIAAKINRALVPAILMPEIMDGKFPKVKRGDHVLTVGTLVKMPDGSRGVVMGYHDGAYMVQRELLRCTHERLVLGLDAEPGAQVLEDNSAKFLRSICEFVSSGEYSLDIIQIGWGRVHVDFDIALAAYTKWLKKETEEPKNAVSYYGGTPSGVPPVAPPSPNPEDECVFEFFLDCKGVFGDSEIKSREFVARFPSDTTKMFVVTVDGHFNNVFATEAEARAVVPNANGVATIRSYDLVVTDRGKDGRPGSGRGALREIFAQPSPSPERRVRPRKPGPNQIIELHQPIYSPEHVSQNEELVLRELDTNSSAGWWTAWWPRKAAIVRIRLSDWEPVANASVPPVSALVFAVTLKRYQLSPAGRKHILLGEGPLTLHSTIDSAQQQVTRHRVTSPRWTEETPTSWVSERGADGSVLRIEITEEKVL